MRTLVALSLSALLVAPVIAVEVDSRTVTAPHVRVTYGGMSEKHAALVARTLSAALEVYRDDFGFPMPETVHCSIDCGPGKPTRLYTDGQDRVFLSVPSPDKLLRPGKSGTFVLYGLSHEPGHIAMYRILKDRDWMTTAAAEGWAHYAGSVVVDRLFEAKGQALWAVDPYDFKADGTARLQKQLAGRLPSDVDRGAGQWRELEGIIGRKGPAALFAAWQAVGQSSPPPEEVSKRLLEAAVKRFPEKEEALKKWWEKAGPLFVEARQSSAFVKAEIGRNRLEGRPVKLEHDDGTSDGKKSIAGGGHARRFAAPGGGDWYLSSVSVFGSRYGPAQVPASATFDVALCDAGMKPVAVWKQPLRLFPRGEAKWVRLDVPPTRVPPGEVGFYVCLNFRPTASQGVFVHYDASTKDGDNHTSVVATPGEPGKALGDGDWMIRVELDRPKAADALGGTK
jgi:hypothetical protein